jgi:hypothetical protein
MIPILLMHTTILHLNFFYKGNFINRNQLHQDDIIYLRSFSDLYIAKMRKAVEENKKKRKCNTRKFHHVFLHCLCVFV